LSHLSKDHLFHRSRTENYFLALSVKTSDLKLARDEIMAPLIEDLKRLEHGITMENGDILQAGLLFYLGDNLESCQVGGFSANFAHGDVCRLCHQQYPDLPNITGIPKSPFWTKEEYNEDAKKEKCERKFGIREECIFNQLEAFHAVGQFPLDAMHDFLEKVGTCDAQAIMVALASSGKIDISRYNDLLSNLSGQGRDRPELVKLKDEKLAGKALSIASHIAVMPYVLSNMLEEEEQTPLLDLLFMLHKLNEFILGECFSLADVYDFQVN